jgi:hypothetical protein
MDERSPNLDDRGGPPRARGGAVQLWRLIQLLLGAAVFTAVLRFLAEQFSTPKPPRAVPPVLSPSESAPPELVPLEKPRREARAPERPSEELEIHHPDGRIEHPQVRYEHRDIWVRWTFYILGIACCIAALHYFLVLKFFWSQQAVQAKLKESPSPLATHPSLELPREPRLEQLDFHAGIVRPNVYLNYAAKETQLHSYGPTDEPGFIHIPIDVAIQRVAGKLPVRERPSDIVVKDNGLVDAGESNSGRMFRGAPK